MLEESGLQYRIVPVNITIGDQLADSFLALNPNHRIPVTVDHAPVEPVVVFESGAILMYLAEKAGCFLPQDVRGRIATVQWVFWQTANMGAKVGEYNHFRRLAGREGDQSYALRRYGDETNRLYGVLNWGLMTQPYLAGE